MDGDADLWKLSPPIYAVGGIRVAQLRAAVDGWIATNIATPPEWAFVNIGVNDMGGSTSQASYEADLAYVLDALHTAWPSCKVGVSYLWVRGQPIWVTAFATWIDNVLATRAAWASISDDERVWMEGGDDGATMTTDGVHYSAAGNTEKVAQLRTAMGY